MSSSSVRKQEDQSSDPKSSVGAQHSQSTAAHNMKQANHHHSQQHFLVEGSADEQQECLDGEEHEHEESHAMSSASSSSCRHCCCGDKKYNGTWPIVALILVLGMAASAAFVGLGIMAAQRDFEHQFHQESLEVAKAIQDVITDSEVAGRWIHDACTRDDRFTTTSNNSANISSIMSSRMAFREVYENLQHADSFQAVGFCPNVTHVQRAAFEAESRLYYETTHLDDMNYVGFIATTTTNNSQHDLTGKEETKDTQLVESSPVAPFYFPWHYLEPFTEENEVDVDLDLYSGSSTRQAIRTALQTWQPALTGRLHILKEDDPHSIAYSVMLIHPGIPLSTQPDRQPQHVAVVEIRIHAILERALPYPVVPVPLSIYLYDTSNSNRGQQAEFLGGVVNYDGRGGELTFSPSDADAFSANLDDYDLKQAYIHELSIGNSSRWTMVLVPTSDTAPFGLYLIMVLVGGLTMLFSSLCLGWCVRSNSIRMQRIAQVQSKADEEKALLRIQTANQAAAKERELNEFIAHEVRNPLAAAMSACAFVSSAVAAFHHAQRHTAAMGAAAAAFNAHPSKDTRRCKSFTHSSTSATKAASINDTNAQQLEDDINIIDSSLHFINDLLRTMLDMHRASSQDIPIQIAPTDVLSDILEPVNSMLYLRDQRNNGTTYSHLVNENNGIGGVRVLVECDPPNLMVCTDALRLKQVILNLARNSTKFVSHGFIRLRARIVKDDNDKERVQLSVEDSGPGIPLENRARMFAKFQESLDRLSQGTGMGLCLCMKLTKLMNIRLWFDENYDSGIPGCPGTRFVLDMDEGPFRLNDEHLNNLERANSGSVSEVSITVSRTNSTEKDEGNHLDLVEKEPDIEQGGRSGELLPNKPESSASSSLILGEHAPSPAQPCLPEKLSVLFVDDDMILRKLFARTIRTVAPHWKIKEAANGETALRLVETETYDLIFMDQYMASVEKQLLGTETTRALRSKGVTSIICGLSANDVKSAFLESGADAFLLKPIPSRKEALTTILLEILNGSSSNNDAGQHSVINGVHEENHLGSNS